MPLDRTPLQVGNLLQAIYYVSSSHKALLRSLLFLGISSLALAKQLWTLDRNMIGDMKSVGRRQLLYTSCTRPGAGS